MVATEFTQMASKWFFSSMIPHVNFQAGGLVATEFAQMAGKRLLASMNPHVNL